MTILTLEIEPLASDVVVDAQKLIVNLEDGRTLSIPLDWYPRLQYGSSEERQNYQLLGGGYAIEWPDLDEHIGIEGLIAGRRSTESAKSIQRWLTAREVS